MIHPSPSNAGPSVENVSATNRNIKELIHLIEVLRTDSKGAKDVCFRETFFGNLKQYIV